MNKEDMTLVLEIARVGLAMVGDEIADELDISDEELVRIKNLVQEATQYEEVLVNSDGQEIGRLV